MLQLLAKHALAGAFEDNEVRILVDAFDQAWKAVQDSGRFVCLRSSYECDAGAARLAHHRDRPSRRTRAQSPSRSRISPDEFAVLLTGWHSRDTRF